MSCGINSAMFVPWREAECERTEAMIVYVDAYEDDTVIVDLKRRITAVRDLLATLARTAQRIAEQPGRRGTIVLVDPQLSRESVTREWERFRRALDSEVAARIRILQVTEDWVPEALAELPERVREQLAPQWRAGERLPRPQMQAEVQRLLILKSYLEASPRTAAWLAETAGCAYRTVAAAVDAMGSAVTRVSGRRVLMTHLPPEPWRRLLANAISARHTITFADRSGQPRSAEHLARKVRELGRADVAIGGVLGAARHHPGLDIVSAPRLDVCVHAPGPDVVPLPLERIDPGLVRSARPDEPIRLAVHFLRRRESFFAVDADGSRWADPVECSLDLHEAGLDGLAQSLLESMEVQRAGG